MTYGENSREMRDSMASLLNHHRILQRLGGPGMHTVKAWTTEAERERMGQIIQRYRLATLTWCLQAVTAATPKTDLSHKAPVRVTCPAEDRKADPTGVGDAFRAGFLAGVAWELPLQRCAQIGSLVATYVIETVGTQEYEFGKDAFLQRIAGTYGDDASADIEPHLRCHRP